MRTLIWAVISLSTLVTTIELHAAEKEWEFGIGAYLWSAGLNGTTGIGPANIDVDASFKDIFENLDRAVMLRGKASKEQWGFYFDYAYLRLKPDDVELLLGDASLKLTQNYADFGMRFAITPSLDFLWGLRYLDVEPQLDLTIGPETTRLQTSADWVDPYLGLKYVWKLTENWSFDLRGDIGGFKVFDGSDLAWMAEAQVTHRPSDRWVWGFGYRHYDVNYESGQGLNRFKYDLSMSGLTIGAGLTF